MNATSIILHRQRDKGKDTKAVGIIPHGKSGKVFGLFVPDKDIRYLSGRIYNTPIPHRKMWNNLICTQGLKPLLIISLAMTF